MKGYISRQYSSKNLNNQVKKSSEKTPHRYEQVDRQVDKQNPYAKINFKSKSNDKSRFSRQYASENRSERYFKRQIDEGRSHKKPLLSGKHMYKSSSQTKNKKVPTQQQFLIRIPKDQNMIENYIQQLKQLKRKIAFQKQALNEQKKAKNQKQAHDCDAKHHSQNKHQRPSQQKSHDMQSTSSKEKYRNITEVHKIQAANYNNEAIQYQNPMKQNRNGPAHQKSAQGISTVQKQPQSKRIFSRDIKKHISKLKIVKQYIDQNQDEITEDVNQQLKDKKQFSQIQSLQGIEQAFLWPKKVIYGNVINVKQSFNIQNPFRHQKFNRFSSSSGRKLFQVSNSTDLKQKSRNDRIQTCQKRKSTNTSESPQHRSNFITNSKSLVLRRKTQHSDIKVIYQSPLKSIRIPNRSSDQTSNFKREDAIQKGKIPKSSLKTNQESPQKINNLVNDEPRNLFKSLEGFSTIEDRKQTLDVLGESCLDIKQNLIQSNKKMDHILDLLGYETVELKQSCRQKEKRRKRSYERFSKAFPKGFFK